jgi:HEAT repeat protein
MGVLDRILGALTGGGAAAATASAAGVTRDQANLLGKSLQPFETIAPALPEQALAYVLEGHHETVLLTLQQAAGREPGALLGQPGRLRWKFYSQHDKALLALAEASLANRAKFYAGVVAAAAPLETLVRLGKLMAAADGGRALEHPGAPVPAWFQILVNDAAFASFNSGTVKHFEKERPAWDIALLARLLEQDGLDPMLALQVVFERKDLDSYYSDRLEPLTHAPAVSTFMRAHPAATAALLTQLSAAGRTALATRLGRDKSLALEFAPQLVALAADGSKNVRAVAVPLLDAIAMPQRLALLTALLSDGDSTQRAQAADLIARLPDAIGRPALDAAAAAETSKPVQQAIRTALTRLDAADAAAKIDLPPAPAWVPFVDAVLGDDALRILMANRRELLERARAAAEAEIESNRTQKYQAKWSQQHHDRMKKVGDDDMRILLKVLNGTAGEKERTRAAVSEVAQCVTHGNRVHASAGFGPMHLLRSARLGRGWYSFWQDNGFQKWLARQPAGSVDLRALADALTRCGQSIDDAALAALNQYWNAPLASALLPADQVWPFFAEHPHYIDQGLGLVAPTKSDDRRGLEPELGPTLKALTMFPVVQARWLARVMEIALGETKTYRWSAQRVLSTLPDVGQRVIDSLTHSKSEVRIEAANWLAELQYKPAIAVLAKALDKESRETVRAAFLTALEALGEDISPWLAPAILLAEARKGLKARPPAGLAWFAFTALPACRWAGGGVVEPEIVQWWTVLACKLKEPGGNALLARYLGLLDAASRKALGSAVLRQFIAHDAAHPSLEVGTAHAQSIAQQRWQGNQQRWQGAKAEHKQYYEADYNKSPDQVFEECRREKMAEYLGSAIGEKGVLALAAHAPAHEAVTLLQQYMRDHYPRRSQIEAMLEAMAGGNDPVVIQLLLGLSRRYRTASVQEKARGLVQQIAERNAWTQEQLADRTIPTAGLDDTGALSLRYGDRVFTVVLDAAMKPELRNPDGKVVKALPEARQTDDAALIKEAKSQFSTHKKELKQVIDLQSARLFEAMCTGRAWPQAEWREYLHAHPVAGRLIQRLVWLEVDAAGAVRRSFRPTEDGSLLDVRDDEVELAPDSLLRLGHASLVDADAAAAWVRHFKDYKLAPLFPQMNRTPPAVAFKDAAGADVTTIADRQGWISDTFTLRGTFTKLGYQRSQAEDGGFFSQYTKEFASAGVRVVLEFSGNTLPEENVPAALKTLAFEDTRVKTWGENALPLASVPPVLLAEAYADYLAVAQACAGFDAGWEKKMPW